MGITEKKEHYSFLASQKHGFEGTLTGLHHVLLYQNFFDVSKPEGSWTCFTRAQENQMEYSGSISKRKNTIAGLKTHLNEKIWKQIQFLLLCSVEPSLQSYFLGIS